MKIFYDYLDHSHGMNLGHSSSSSIMISKAISVISESQIGYEMFSRKVTPDIRVGIWHL